MAARSTRSVTSDHCNVVTNARRDGTVERTSGRILRTIASVRGEK
jgi:hypothetical protein